MRAPNFLRYRLASSSQPARRRHCGPRPRQIPRDRKSIRAPMLATPAINDRLTAAINEGLTPGINEGLTPGINEGLTPEINEGLTPGINDRLSLRAGLIRRT